MRKQQYKLITTVPSWIFLALSAILLGAYWFLIIRLMSTGFSIYFGYLGITYPVYVAVILSAIPVLLLIVFLAVAPKLRNPHAALIPFFVFELLEASVSFASVVFNGIHGYGNWLGVIISALVVLLICLPCLLNSCLFRQQWIYIVCGVLALLNAAVSILSFAFLAARYEGALRMYYQGIILSSASTALLVFSWMLCGAMIRRIRQPRAGSAPAPAMGQFQPCQTPYAPPAAQTPPYGYANPVPPCPPPAPMPSGVPAAGTAAQSAAQPDAPAPEPSVQQEATTPLPPAGEQTPMPEPPAPEARQVMYCMECGRPLPVGAKFCDRCGTKVEP